jgi:hypothetical protein
MSDQTVTPFTLNISLSEEGNLSAVRIRLGEPGEGRSGISGPAWGSTDVLKSLRALDARLETVDWVYNVTIKP